MFTKGCFIRKNSEKLRSELDKFGYENFRNPNDLQYLITLIKVPDFNCFYDSFDDESIINFLNNNPITNLFPIKSNLN